MKRLQPKIDLDDDRHRDCDLLPNALDLLFDKLGVSRVTISKSQCLNDGSEQFQVFTDKNPDICTPARTIPEAASHAADRIRAKNFFTSDVDEAVAPKTRFG